MKFTLVPGHSVRLFLQGFIQAKMSQMTALFGEPVSSNGAAVCWCVHFEDGTLATIYIREHPGSGDGVTPLTFRIAGLDRHAVEMVHQEFRIYHKLMAIY
ncbi:hypothetical protein ATN89_17690 [Comamonas thiooxydans]|uniref:hypothetical protein n=1 Tax=Comamonas thiooxydans TaxID=363952 RepID=UPI0007C42C65|nr:hypothetical protein [Comamonas thiooxydans]OAD82915.1 hypothetical protein ATN89_17690 [Comamonas thiooxydans]